MNKKKVTIVLVILLCLFAIIKLFPSKSSKNFSDFGVGKKQIALINIEGELTNNLHIMELLNLYSNMKSVKAIILRINSPGGSVGASQEIYRQIKKVKEKGKLIVSSISDVGASGAYYVAMASDKIYSNPGTITGSIGVIINYMNAEKLLGKIGVDFVTVKSGKYKDAGSFSRQTSEDEKLLFQKLINDVLDQFVNDMVESRMDKLAEAASIKEKDENKRKEMVKKYVLNNIADGRIITGLEAKKLGLIDEIGNIDDAIEATAATLGISGRPLVLSEKKKTGLNTWLNSKLENFTLKNDYNILKYLMFN
ncbi:MAG: signal peptide peptidase SppA [Candidatus Goldbacteria bacterium]|nr:signal peptide peptidase SppA [Candidatus Goldiibacteriota bacterium]